MAKTDSSVYVANTSFSASFDDGERDDKGNIVWATDTARLGQKFRGNHRLVKLAPSYFDAPDGDVPVIEAATAAPGELRGA